MPVPCHAVWLEAMPVLVLPCSDVLYCAGLGFALRAEAIVLS